MPVLALSESASSLTAPADLTLRWLALSLDVSIKAVALALVAVVLLRLFRVRDVNIRHRVWAGVLAAMLLLPALTHVVPALRLPFTIPADWFATSAVDEAPVPVSPAPADLPPVAADKVDHSLPASALAEFAGRPSLPVDPWGRSRPGGMPRGPSPELVGDDSPDALPIAAATPPAEQLVDALEASTNTAASVPVSTRLLRVLPALLCGAWLLGAALMTLRLLVGMWLAFRLQRNSTLIPRTALRGTGSGPANDAASSFAAGTAITLLQKNPPPRAFLPSPLAGEGSGKGGRTSRSAQNHPHLRPHQGSGENDEFLHGREGIVPHRNIPVRECPSIRTPLTVGWARPQILLPLQWKEWSSDKLHAVLAHERTHAERGDCLLALLAEVNRCCYWFHPLSWWLRQHLASLAEAACDDAAVDSTGDRTQYARHLLEVAASVSAQRGRVAAFGVSMARRSHVETRIHAILDFTRPLSRRLTWGTTLVLLGIIVPMIALAAALRPGDGKEETTPNEVAAAVAEDSSTEAIAATTPSLDPPVNGGKDEGVAAGTESAAAKSVEVAAVDKDARPAAATEADDPTYTFAGTVVDPNGKPVEGASVYFDYIRNVFPAPSAAPVAVSDARGEFTFRYGKRQFVETSEGFLRPSARLVAVRDGYGLASNLAIHFETTGTFGKQLTTEQKRSLDWAMRGAGPTKSVLQFVADDAPIRGRIITNDGRPVAGATIETSQVYGNAIGNLDAWDEVTKKATADFLTLINEVREISNGRFLSGVTAVPKTLTDADGRFTLKGVGRERLVELYVSGSGIATTSFHARSRAGEIVRVPYQRDAAHLGHKLFHPGDFTGVVGPSAPVDGRITDRKTGAPLANLPVHANKLATDEIHGTLAAIMLQTQTDADGRYRLEGLPVGKNIFQVIPPPGSPYLPGGVNVTIGADAKPIVRDVGLTRGVVVRGRVTDRRTGAPIVGQVEYFAFSTNPHLRELDGFREASPRSETYRTDSNGRYEIPALPGKGILTFMATEHESYPLGVGADAIEERIGGTSEIMFATAPTQCHANRGNVLKQIELDPAAESLTLDLTLDGGEVIAGHALAPDGTALSDFYVNGCGPGWPEWRSIAEERFEVTGYFPARGRRIFVYHPARNLAGYREFSGPAPAKVDIPLQPAGTLTGRVVDADGTPLESIWLTSRNGAAFNPQVMSRPDQPALDGLLFEPGRGARIQTDAEGRFVLKGLVPGMKYSVEALGTGDIAPTLLGMIFTDETVAPGETKDLGDLSPLKATRKSAAKPKEVEPAKKLEKPQAKSDSVKKPPLDPPVNGGKDVGVTAAAPAPSESQAGAKDLAAVRAQARGEQIVRGRVVDEQGRPVAGAEVAVVASRVRAAEGGDDSPRRQTLAEGVSASDGRFELRLVGFPKKTHSVDSIIARSTTSGLAWVRLKPNATEIDETLTLRPEQIIRGRLVDIEGQPVRNLPIAMTGVWPATDGGWPRDGVGFDDAQKLPRVWPMPVKSDETGRFEIHGIAARHGVYLEIEGTDRIARQDVYLNTGMSEERGPRDGTYRNLVRNFPPGVEGVLPLAPAQLFTGVIRYEDTGEPAPHARLVVSATQQREGGSWWGVDAQADEQGRYRVNPRPGIRFEIMAYPPGDAPYLIRVVREIVRKESKGDHVVDIALPRGVLVRGRVVEEGTGAPVAKAAIQYVPRDATQQRAGEDIVTGWQGIRHSRDDGAFEIVILPGAGTLVAHGPQGKYVVQETTSRSVSRGFSGGRRYYAHAFLPVEAPDLAGSASQSGSIPIEVTLRLVPGATVAGRIENERGEPVERATLVGRQQINPYYLEWRAIPEELHDSRFEISGLAEGVKYPVHFLDAKNRLGATALISAADKNPTVRLVPCGQAVAKLVSKKGEPVTESSRVPSIEFVVTPASNRLAMAMGFGTNADADFASNIEQKYPDSDPVPDRLGRVTYSPLIPGSRYRIRNFGENGVEFFKEFVAESGKTEDLGPIVLPTEE